MGHLERHGVSFINLGFGTEMPAAFEEQVYQYTGIHMNVSFPLPKPLFDRTSRKFATYNMAIPDQFRVDMFEEELRDKWTSGKEPFPRLLTMVLPMDHLTREHPADGYPFRESCRRTPPAANSQASLQRLRSPRLRLNSCESSSDLYIAERRGIGLISAHPKAV